MSTITIDHDLILSDASYTHLIDTNHIYPTDFHHEYEWDRYRDFMLNLAKQGDLNHHIEQELARRGLLTQIREVANLCAIEFAHGHKNDWRIEHEPVQPIEDVEVNKYHTNALLKFHVQNDEIMKANRFNQRNDGTWSYFKTIKVTDPTLPKHERKKYGLNLCLYITVDNDNILNVQLLDDDFCQPYDYQYLESHGYGNVYTKQAREFVEKELTALQNANIISGFTPGMYV